MIRFEHPAYLYGLLIVIPLCLLFWAYRMWRKKALHSFSRSRFFSILIPNASNARHNVKFLLFVVAICFLIVGWANPQIGTKYEKVKRKGVDVMIAVDVSKSMLAEDVAPNRMLRAKQFVSNLIDQFSNDRVGLIVFAGNAYLQMPLTVDYAAARMYLKTIETDMVPTQGTAIGDAVNIARQSFEQQEKKYKVLLLITDGENHEGDAYSAIQAAVDEGVIVHTLGIGTEKGAPIPEANGQFKKDTDGSIVYSKLNISMLQEIAKKGNGSYFDVLSNNDVEEAVMKEIGQLEGKEFDEKIFTDYNDQFQYFLGIAFCILLIDLSIAYRKKNVS